jgi:hypothetical protein
MINRKLVDKKNIVMTLALITTLSTTSYIALFIIVVIYSIYINKKINPFALILPSLIVFTILFLQVEFLQNKIITQLNETEFYYNRGLVGNRFVSALVDLNDFIKYPLFGKGYGELSSQLQTEFTRNRSNGVSSHLANFGIIFFLFYFINMYISLLRFSILYDYNKTLSYFLLGLIIILGFSEQYFNHPFFYALTMLHLTIPLKMLIYLKWNTINILSSDHK